MKAYLFNLYEVPIGFSTYFKSFGHAQTINESNDFDDVFVKACKLSEDHVEN